MILWHFTRCGEFSEGLIYVSVSNGNIHMSKFDSCMPEGL